MTTMLDACAVLHTPALSGPLLRMLRRIAAAAGRECRVRTMVSRGGGLDTQRASALCTAAGCESVSSLEFDDRFLDFSGYVAGAAQLLDAGSPGAIFVNDTLVSKHASAFLARRFADAVASLHDDAHPFPVLAGPYRHSEFSYGDGRDDEFVATFLFYLNASGMRRLLDVGAGLEAARQALLDDAPPTESTIANAAALDAGALRMCWLHRSQLASRYAARPDAPELLARKLATAHAERALSAAIRADGAVRYIASGIKSQIVVAAQSALSRQLHRFG